MIEQYKPEIGEYCEVYLNHRWYKVKCVGYDGDYIVWKDPIDDDYYCTHKSEVRKYEDPYTLFSKELKLLFDYDSRIYHNLNSSDYQAVIKLLWDNGYRKVEG